jgi:HEAT repeat protein
MHVNDPATLKAITNLSADADERVRAAVVRAMIVMGTRTDLQAIVADLAGDKSMLVKSAVAMAERRLRMTGKPPTTGPA